MHDEKHWTVPQLAEIWGMSQKTIRMLFANESGVMKLANPETRKKRGYTSLYIPDVR